MDASPGEVLPTTRIRVGPAGWSYEDWKGRVYPPHPGRRFDPLPWIARFFDAVEVNASFYRIPSPQMAESWVHRVEDRPEFRFTVKLHRSFTHDRPGVDPALTGTFRDFLRPLEEARRLGPVLAQFPWSFRNTSANRDHLLRLADALSPLFLVVELRHGSWGRDEGRIVLPDPRLHPVSVDQPQVGDALPPVLQEDPGFAYLRLHGRNARNWFHPRAGRDQRYDYRYPADELRALLAPLASPSAPRREGYVITNNHFQGQAVVNALEIRALLGEERIEFPRWLEEEFPEIKTALREMGATAVVGIGEEASEPSTEEARDRSQPGREEVQGELFG